LSLEETSALFDGEKALDHIVGQAANETEVKDDMDEKGSGSSTKELKV
jgi:hypothetical protein